MPSAISKLDRTYPEGFRLGPIRGYAEDHALTLDLSGLPADHTLLVLTAWTDYAFSSDNVAASQRGLALKPPALEVRGQDGAWRTVIEDIGIGRTAAEHGDDLTAMGSATVPRIVTIMRSSTRSGRGAGFSRSPLKSGTIEARLAERGSRRRRADGGPFSYEYANASWSSPWKVAPGRFTRGPATSASCGRSRRPLRRVEKPGDGNGPLRRRAEPSAPPEFHPHLPVVRRRLQQEVDINTPRARTWFFLIPTTA
jgi:hypothetical protein